MQTGEFVCTKLQKSSRKSTVTFESALRSGNVEIPLVKVFKEEKLPAI